MSQKNLKTNKPAKQHADELKYKDKPPQFHFITLYAINAKRTKKQVITIPIATSVQTTQILSRNTPCTTPTICSSITCVTNKMCSDYDSCKNLHTSKEISNSVTTFQVKQIQNSKISK
jgi:hypothetical protein